MKNLKKFIVLFAVLFLFPGLISKSGNNNPVFNNSSSTFITDNQFMIGAMGSGSDISYTNSPLLNLNCWHVYTKPGGGIYPNQGWPNVDNDNWYSSVSLYGNGITDWITNNTAHNMRSVMNRPKIDYFGKGQKSSFPVRICF